jgi:hypothetical protein
MLTFLRKIRKSLIKTGSAQKYLLYAIGEIALVVIGILIALQINNWNEDKKDRRLEIATLHELLESLDSDLTAISLDSTDRMMDVQVISNLLKHIENQKPNHDSLHSLLYYPFRGTYPKVDDTGFNLLSSRGIDLISNAELRKIIIKHYSHKNHVLEQIAYQANVQLEDFRKIYMTKVGKKLGEYFIGFTGRQYTKSYPLDYESLLEDTQFHNQLRWRISRRELEADRMGIYLISARTLVKDINNEINRLKIN